MKTKNNAIREPQEDINKYIVKKGDYFTGRLFMHQTIAADKGFKWYKANDKTQAENIIALLSKRSNKQNFGRLMPVEKDLETCTYPTFIGYNFYLNKLFFLYEIKEEFKYIEKSYHNLMQDLSLE